MSVENAKNILERALKRTHALGLQPRGSNPPGWDIAELSKELAEEIEAALRELGEDERRPQGVPVTVESDGTRGGTRVKLPNGDFLYGVVDIRWELVTVNAARPAVVVTILDPVTTIVTEGVRNRGPAQS